MRNLRAARHLAVLVAVTAVLAGCSESDPPATTPDASTITTTPTQTPAAQTRELAAEPEQIADDLVADEYTVRDPGSTDDALAAASYRQQAAYRLLGRQPEWDPIVRPRIPPPLLETFDRNLDARRQLALLNEAALPDTLPAWTIVAPAPAEELLGYYREAEAASGVNWTHLAAINLIETRFGRIAGQSTAGAVGPMQFLPSTFAEYGAGGDISSPRDSILAAGRFLAANGYADNPDGALFRYNNSDHYVQAVNDYAAVLTSDPATFAGYYRWDVYYNTTAGDVLLPLGYSAIAPISAADYLAGTVNSALAVSMSQQSEAILQRILSAGAAVAGEPQRSEVLSGEFLGTPYGAHTLVGSETEPEQLVVDLERVDCFTYADYVEALKRATNRDEFLDALVEVRYKGGDVSFTSRKHFFTDWAADTPAIATDVTKAVSANTIDVAKTLNQRDSGGVYLPGLPVVDRQLAYIPSASVDEAVVGGLRTGDYVGAYASDGGLDVTHVGIFVAGPDGPVFRNASSLSSSYMVVDTPFFDYVQTVPGIVVLRPVA